MFAACEWRHTHTCLQSSHWITAIGSNVKSQSVCMILCVCLFFGGDSLLYNAQPKKKWLPCDNNYLRILNTKRWSTTQPWKGNTNGQTPCESVWVCECVFVPVCTHSYLKWHLERSHDTREMRNREVKSSYITLWGSPKGHKPKTTTSHSKVDVILSELRRELKSVLSGGDFTNMFRK